MMAAVSSCDSDWRAVVTVLGSKLGQLEKNKRKSVLKLCIRVGFEFLLGLDQFLTVLNTKQIRFVQLGFPIMCTAAAPPLLPLCCYFFSRRCHLSSPIHFFHHCRFAIVIPPPPAAMQKAATMDHNRKSVSPPPCCNGRSKNRYQFPPWPKFDNTVIYI
ncbi:hypothetical protein V8G54_006476 [Vigna mungo]|uniref:Uncharacterized protein n=1 Tax=Vigna mungo TaxID=3915 RepID=A0AAQ3NZX3_VIGMU